MFYISSIDKTSDRYTVVDTTDSTEEIVNLATLREYAKVVEIKGYSDKNVCTIHDIIKKFRALGKLMGRYSNIDIDVSDNYGRHIVCHAKNTNIVNAYIPDFITCLDECSFESCDSLVEIIIPDSVERVLDGCFSGCEHLKKIKLSANQQIINDIFTWCGELEEVIIPEGITTLGDNCLSFV